jgi:hypothetical protein
MAIATTPDIAAIEAFAGKTFGDLAGTMSILLATIGDRLGLYKVLAERGALTSQELAAVANVDERYAREWLNGSASSGYLAYDSPTGTFFIPDAHAPVLAGEGSPAFIGCPPPSRHSNCSSTRSDRAEVSRNPPSATTSGPVWSETRWPPLTTR